MMISELTVPYGAAWNASQRYRTALRRRQSAENAVTITAKRYRRTAMSGTKAEDLTYKLPKYR
jgi:hypothetical protein